MLKNRSGKEELIIRANNTMRKAPEIDTDILKLMSVKELEEMLENYKLILLLFAINSKNILEKMGSDFPKFKDINIEVKKISLDDLLKNL